MRSAGARRWARRRARDGGNASWKRSPCLGQCERAPAVLVTAPARRREPSRSRPSRAASRRSSALLGRSAGDGRHAAWAARRRCNARCPRSVEPGLRLLRRIGRVGSHEPRRLPRQRRLPGAGAGDRARTGRRHRGSRRLEAVGRGGAAFPTGRKWEAVAKAPARPHYLVCNADESEPGTFKDRVLMEEDPFAVVEGMTIAGYATGCERGFIYMRGEYPLARRADGRRHRGGARRRAARRRRHGRGLRLRHRDPPRRRRLHLRRGDGALQLDRGQARRAAQQAAVPGAGRPLRQADRRQQRRDAGQRAGARSSRAARPTPASAPAARRGRSSSASRATSRGPASTRSPFGDHAARAARPGRRRPGGRRCTRCSSAAPPASFVGPDDARRAADLRGHARHGATLGSGVVMVFDETRRPARHRCCASPSSSATSRAASACPAAWARCGRKSCWRGCAPAGRSARDAEELALLQELGQAMRDASICGLGQTASSADRVGARATRARRGRRP